MKSLLSLLAQVEVNTDSLPRSGADGTSDLIISTLNIIFGILAGIAFISVIYGGFKYVTSQGQPDKLGKAKDVILYSIIGLGIALSAFGIVNFFLKALM